MNPSLAISHLNGANIPSRIVHRTAGTSSSMTLPPQHLRATVAIKAYVRGAEFTLGRLVTPSGVLGKPVRDGDGRRNNRMPLVAGYRCII